jgi:hypothetical protein
MNAVELIPLQNANANATSVYFDLGEKIDYAIQVVFTGVNVSGILTVEVSVDPAKGFVTVENSSQTVNASAGHVWNVVGAGYRYVRVRWVYSSGTGNISAYLHLKS